MAMGAANRNMGDGGDGDYDDEDEEEVRGPDDNEATDRQPQAAEGAGGGADGEGGEDLINYKGIYFNDDQGQKYTDPDNGAHFEFRDMCKRLSIILGKRKEIDKQLGLPPEFNNNYSDQLPQAASEIKSQSQLKVLHQ